MVPASAPAPEDHLKRREKDRPNLLAQRLRYARLLIALLATSGEQNAVIRRLARPR